jgi:hypothetical protein
VQTSEEHRHNAEVCLKLANETTESEAQMAWIVIATIFHTLAEDWERRAPLLNSWWR